jgi:hypothetical protein
MDIFDVVVKLNGSVEPVGDSHIDERRLGNLRALCNLTAELLECIESVAESTNDHMASVKAARDVATAFMADLAKGLADRFPCGVPVVPCGLPQCPAGECCKSPDCLNLPSFNSIAGVGIPAACQHQFRLEPDSAGGKVSRCVHCTALEPGGVPEAFKPDWTNYEQGRKDGRTEVLENVPSSHEWLRLKQPETYRRWCAGTLTPSEADWMAGWDACRAAADGVAETQPLPYATPLELWRAFKDGTKFVLHYHGKTFDVTHMDPREKVVYIKPPGMPVKVYPDGRSAEGVGSNIWLAAAGVETSDGGQP